MKPKFDDTELTANRKNPDFPGYPVYPSGEDIYRKFREEKDMNPENTAKNKTSNVGDSSEKWNEKDFRDDKSGNDLDIPGSELDDELEDVGEEDEENNFYSLGGDENAN
jgi:hypothetical protein